MEGRCGVENEGLFTVCRSQKPSQPAANKAMLITSGERPPYTLDDVRDDLASRTPMSPNVIIVRSDIFSIGSRTRRHQKTAGHWPDAIAVFEKTCATTPKNVKSHVF